MIVICEHCNQPYKTKQSRLDGYEHHFCSRQCAVEYRVANYIKNYPERNVHFNLIEYVDKDSVTIECKICGWRENTNSKNALTRKTCEECQMKYLERKRKDDEIARAKNNLIRKKKKELRTLQRRLEKEVNKLEKNYQKKLTEDDRKEAIRQRKRASDKRNELKRNRSMFNNGAIDKDITLERVYERDGGLCHICGMYCNYDDHKINPKGAFIVGRYYPSIDHITPLSKGGTHTWDNVQLAHIGCNSWKGNKSRPAF